ncbi:hypothetical protein KC968_02090 [Candidatus Saccharibacteria bacterium]|nr:hypothetical protein [Candidatus Saccharibacteria bacterium]
MKIAIQGIAGSFHHEAAIQILGHDIELLYCDTFQQVFDAVQGKAATNGIVAVENSLYGSINAVYRLLARTHLWVQGETTLHISQYLIAAHNQPLEQIHTVMSQAPALAQCELWLTENMPKAHLEETHDTADSVRFVVAHPERRLAAIASKHAAEMYKGTIIAGPINDETHNYTRFFLLGKDKLLNPKATKTSIILETNHQPAALYNALGAFASAGINLSKLDSHPIATDKNHYAFYVDFDTGLGGDFNHPVLDKLRSQGCKVTILGSYFPT